MPTPPHPAPAPAPCVVAINDDAVFLAMLGEMLALHDYACHAVLYADLDRAFAHLGAEAPAAIILDVRLGRPEEGWAIRERLKGDPALRRVPLIMCSADSRALARRAADLAAAGDAALPKPFAMDDLVATLARVTAGRDMQKPAAGAAHSPRPA